jgi:hypothetical protein
LLRAFYIWKAESCKALHNNTLKSRTTNQQQPAAGQPAATFQPEDCVTQSKAEAAELLKP